MKSKNITTSLFLLAGIGLFILGIGCDDDHEIDTILPFQPVSPDKRFVVKGIVTYYGSPINQHAIYMTIYTEEGEYYSSLKTKETGKYLFYVTCCDGDSYKVYDDRKSFSGTVRFGEIDVVDFIYP